MAARKDAPKFDDLFAELNATVEVPEDLVLSTDPRIVLECPSLAEVEALNAASDEEAAQRIIFKDQYDDAKTLFGGKPLNIWNAFMDRYKSHFFNEADLGK